MLLHALLLLTGLQANPADQLEAELRALAAPLIEGEVVPGLVVSWLAPNGKTGSFGLGQLSRTDPRTPDEHAIFELGSVTKTFTALLLARRVVDGELELEGQLRDLLPEDYRPPLSAKPVRLVDLATHSSGFPEIPTNLERDLSLFVVDYSGFDEARLQDFLSHFEPLSAPGQHFRYSNAGFGVLGWALSRQSGQRYEQLLRTELFEPLGLTDTFLEITPERRERLTPSHDPNGDPVPPADFATLEACGAIRSTAADVMHFLSAELTPAGPLREALELTQKVHFRDPSGIALGLAWFHSSEGGYLFHDGQTGGQACFVFFNPTTRCAGLVLANGSTIRVADLGARIMHRVGGTPVEPPPIRVGLALSEAQLEPLTGLYLSLYGSVLSITREEDRLYARLPRQPAFRMHCSEPARFFYRDIEAELSFEFEAEGEPAGAVVLHQNGREIRYTRAK